MRKFDETCKESLSTAELSEMLVDYAQINERLEAENKRLRAESKRLTQENEHLDKRVRSILSNHLRCARKEFAIEKAVRRFVSDPAIAPFFQSLDADEVLAQICDGPDTSGGDAT